MYSHYRNFTQRVIDLPSSYQADSSLEIVNLGTGPQNSHQIDMN